MSPVRLSRARLTKNSEEVFCGLAASGRDIGAACSGGFFQRNGYSVVRYDLAVFNGEGIKNSEEVSEYW